ncbi:MAG: ABC transporter ATP-binding protein [Actinomycetota bacterium]
MDALSYRQFCFSYADAPEPALREISFVITRGEFVVVAGQSGSGKSTLLRAANGLVPYASGGRCGGDVVVVGRSTRTHKPRELADVVGFVHQDPEAQFVVDHVERDIAFVLENLGLPEHAMRRRVEEVLDALAIAYLRDREPTSLSGGERQRVAIAGALAAAPDVLVLDEPTSQLDPQGADDVLSALARLNAELGTTIVLAEHRLERAAPLADRAVLVAHGRVTADGPPATTLGRYPGAPPVVRLARIFGWEPPPLTVKDARARIASVSLPDYQDTAASAPGEELVRASGIDVVFDGFRALRGVELALHRGEIVALLGRNGAGKTSLLRTLANLTSPRRGRVHREGRVAYVPQDPSALLFAPTVHDEVAATLQLVGGAVDDEAVDAMLQRVGLAELARRHPRTLSGGERQRLAIAAVAVSGAEVLALDEPTRGMDAQSRAALVQLLRVHAADGGAAIVATHDVELAARVASRVVVLGAGEIIAAGDARDVLAGSLFAPQVLRIAPPFLTVDEVERAVAVMR